MPTTHNAPAVAPASNDAGPSLDAPPPARIRLHSLVACGVAIGIYPLGLVLGVGSTNPRHVALFFVAFVPYLIAVALALRIARQDERAALSASQRRALWVAIVAIALALRLATLATSPSLSDDLYRYIWDGKVVGHGINPYRYAPDAPELAGLRNEHWLPINAKELTTPYPPGAEAVFAATYRIAGESVKAQQVVATIGDALVILALALLLRRLRRSPARLLIYAWSPLALMQLAHSAHNDGWMIAALLFALLAAVTRRPALGALALASSVLVKFFAGIALPALAASWKPRHLAMFGAVIAVAFAPFAVEANPLRGVLTEAGGARFNDSLFFVCHRLLGLAGPGMARLTEPLIGLALLVAMAVIWQRVRGGASPVDGTFWLVGLLLLALPVVEPWYPLWILPLVALLLRPGRPWRWDAPAAWLVFSGLIALTDLTYTFPSSRTWIVVRATEYLPLYGIIGLALWQRLRARSAPREAPAST